MKCQYPGVRQEHLFGIAYVVQMFLFLRFEPWGLAWKVWDPVPFQTSGSCGLGGANSGFVCSHRGDGSTEGSVANLELVSTPCLQRNFSRPIGYPR